MKNKETQTAFIVGFLALAVGQGFRGVFPRIANIIGTILLVWGTVKYFKERKD